MANTIAVQITATDLATATIERVNKSLARMTAPLERTRAALGRFADVSGLNKTAAGMQAVARHAATATERLGRFAPALAGITSAASIAGVAALVERWGQFGAQLGRDAYRVQASVAGLQSLQNAARLSGGTAEDMTGSLQALGDALYEGVGGRAPQVVVAMQTLGIALRNANGSARTAADVLPEVADRIARIGDPRTQAQVLRILGISEKLLPIMRRGAAGLREAQAEAAKYGLTNERGVEAARRFQEAQAKVAMAVEGVTYSVASRLAPILVPMLERLASWLAAHGGQIAAFFERVAITFSRWVDAGGVDNTIKALGRFSNGVENAINLLGGFQNAAGVLLAFMATRWAVGMVGSVARVTGALTGMGAALPKPGAAGGLPSLLATGLPAAGIALDLSAGRTAEEQHEFGSDSWLAKLGKAVADAIDLKFDENGQSQGYLDILRNGRWTGASPRENIGAGLTPGNRYSTGAGSLPPGAVQVPAALMPYYRAASAATGVPVEVLLAKDRQESDFGRARGSGRDGIGQILPSTARNPGYGMQGVDPETLKDPAANIAFGAEYLARKAWAAGVRNWNDPAQRARGLAAYNGGGDPNYVQHVERFLPAARAAAAPPVASGAPATPPPSPGGTVPNGQVNVGVRFENQPPNVRTNLTSTGQGITTSLNIQRAMPELAP